MRLSESIHAHTDVMAWSVQQTNVVDLHNYYLLDNPVGSPHYERMMNN
jgi:hypothetical protein